MKKSFKVSYDVCTFCNHQCNFCSNADPRTLKAKTSKEEFEHVMDNLCKSIDIHSLSLSAKGEVLLNRDLEAIIMLAKQKYAIEYVYCSTNGSLLDAKRIETLVKSGIDSIKFSINALDRESYAKIHLKDDFNR
ncbi:MAG: radical SAM protein [Sulfurimonas sp.]|nr:radical SAM protein [Sulfurimonas sp.]